MPHADSPTCSMGLIQTHQGWWQHRYGCSPFFSTLSLSAYPAGPPTHTMRLTNQSSSPYLSSEPLPWISVWSVWCKPEKCTSLNQFCLCHSFHTHTDLVSPPGFKTLWQEVMFTPLLHRLCCRLGQASCCSSNSIVLNADVGRIKLVIFQAWSVLGQYAIREG